MRRSLVAAFLMPIAVSAQTAFGTKADLAARPTGTVATTGSMPILQMVVALILVGAMLKWVMPFLIQRFGKGRLPSSGSLQVQETIPFAGGQLYVVKIRGRELLLSGTGTTVTYLTDLSGPHSAPADPPLFAELVQKEVARPNVAPFALAHEDVDAKKAAEALDRLERLLGR